MGQEAHRLATIITRYVSGSAKSFNGETNVDLNNKYVILDISEMTQDMQPVGMFVALDYIYDKGSKKTVSKRTLWME